jgi:hypothetical protein
LLDQTKTEIEAMETKKAELETKAKELEQTVVQFAEKSETTEMALADRAVCIDLVLTSFFVFLPKKLIPLVPCT